MREDRGLWCRGKCLKQGTVRRGSRSQPGALQDMVRSGWWQGEVLGGQAEKECREDRAGREGGTPCVLWLRTGVPFARATSKNGGQAYVVSGVTELLPPAL